MAGRSKPLVIGIVAAAALALGALWLRPAPGGAPRAASSAEGGTPGPAGSMLASPVTEPAIASPAGGADPFPPPAAKPAAAVAAATLRPEDGPEAEAWRAARVVFRPRELGKMGASVKVALDQARREMEFCFRDRTGASSGVAAPRDDAAAPPPDPAILLLYLQAREGALDVVDAQVDYLGDATPALVDCCREVLRGLEIRAFDAVPGRRYRLKFPLE